MPRALVLIVLCAILAGGIAGCVMSQQTTPTHYRVTAGNTTVDAEAATTAEQQEIGLMNRTSLGLNAGMLFVFSQPQRQSMWMKNTQIPLDIVFITDDLRVQRIYADVPPCTADPCPTYDSIVPIRYVLEVNAGFCAQHNITSGVAVTITPS